MNRNNPRLIYYGLIDKIEAILRGWDDILVNDPREHPVVPVHGNPVGDDIPSDDQKASRVPSLLYRSTEGTSYMNSNACPRRNK